MERNKICPHVAMEWWGRLPYWRFRAAEGLFLLVKWDPKVFSLNLRIKQNVLFGAGSLPPTWSDLSSWETVWTLSGISAVRSGVSLSKQPRPPEMYAKWCSGPLCNCFCDSLDEHFHGRWLGRRRPHEWPQKSSDIISCDFFLWGWVVKTQVYKTRQRSFNHGWYNSSECEWE